MGSLRTLYLVREFGSMDEKPADNEEKRRRYNELVRKARLVSIMLDGLNFKMDPSYFSSERKDVKRFIDSEMGEFDYSAEKGVCISNIKWTLMVKKGRKNLIKCTANYVVIYDGIKEFDIDVIEVFVDSVVSTASYAYFRGLYAHLDWSAMLNSPPLPILKQYPRV